MGAREPASGRTGSLQERPAELLAHLIRFDTSNPPGGERECIDWISGKGAAAVLLARWLFGEDAAALAGGAAFVGHLFPVWLKFKGGKGVATFFGVLIALAWPVGLMAGLTWIIIAAIFRISSLAALTAAAMAPLYMFLAAQSPESKLWLAAFMAVEPGTIRR